MASNCEHPTVEPGEASFTCGACGKPVPGLPLDRAFQLPDDIWELEADEREERCRISSDFVGLDDERYFVRCLLPIPIDGSDEEFRFGVWVEVDAETFRQVWGAWDDEGRYDQLSFGGVLANRLATPTGTFSAPSVQLMVRDANVRPYVYTSADPTLADLLREGWTSEIYANYAASLP